LLAKDSSKRTELIAGMSLAAHDPAMKIITKRRRLRLRQSPAQTAVFVFQTFELELSSRSLAQRPNKIVGTDMGVADDFGFAVSIPGGRSG
jgi:hypothetical protein